MVWPFGPSDSKNSSRHDEEKSRQSVSWSDTLLGTSTIDQFAAAKEWAPVVAMSFIGLGALQLYANYLRRIPGAAFVPPSLFRSSSRSLFGRVTSVGDGDNFRLFHTPGGKAAGWGWLRTIPSKRKELVDRTVRLNLKPLVVDCGCVVLTFPGCLVDFNSPCWCRCAGKRTLRKARPAILSRCSQVVD